MKFIARNRNFILFTIGSLLIILSFILIFYDRFTLLKANVFSEIELEKNKENNRINDKLDETFEKENNETEVILSADTDIINDDSKNSSNNGESSSQNTIKKEYIGYLKINKINLNQGLVSKNSYYNNVSYNIMMLKESDYPDKEKGNVILAAHSGSGSIAYFKNLYQLSINDEALIYYKSYIYTYRIVNIYNIPKTGTAEIRRNYEKSVLTLITCTYNSKTEQTIYILELISKKEAV